MIWGYPYFWKHPYGGGTSTVCAFAIQPEGFQTLMPRHEKRMAYSPTFKACKSTILSEFLGWGYWGLFPLTTNIHWKWQLWDWGKVHEKLEYEDDGFLKRRNWFLSSFRFSLFWAGIVSQRIFPDMWGFSLTNVDRFVWMKSEEKDHIFCTEGRSRYPYTRSWLGFWGEIYFRKWSPTLLDQIVGERLKEKNSSCLNGLCGYTLVN